MTKKRNVNLDGLKLLACFAVIGLHVFTYNYNNTIITYIHYMCGYAVPIFFLVNGYLILNKKEVTYTYTAKKILKILFLIVLWNLVYFLLKLVIKQQLENPIILVAESLIQEGFFWQFWFLGAMILTYLFAPLIHKVVNRFRYSYPLLLILTLLPA